MSQHLYSTTVDNQQFVIRMGWDNSCNWFYCLVFTYDLDGHSSELVYSNLSEEDPAILSVEYFIEKCREFGVSVPQDIISEVRFDKESRKNSAPKMHLNIDQSDVFESIKFSCIRRIEGLSHYPKQQVNELFAIGLLSVSHLDRGILVVDALPTPPKKAQPVLKRSA